MEKSENNQSVVQLDKDIEKYYSLGNEKDRLDHHRLEKDRTLMLLKKIMPAAPAVVLDVGGATGVYAFPLTQQGYQVHLIDPISLHIEQALNFEQSHAIKLASCLVGDARQIEKEEGCADVVLLFGPLYHLISLEDRLKALREAYRVLKPSGKLFAVGISRFATLMDSLYKGVFPAKKQLIEKELKTGIHHKIVEGFDFGYLHTVDELKGEIQNVGFKTITMHAIEGPVWIKQQLADLSKDLQSWQELLSLLDKIEQDETILGASAHIMAIATK